MFLSLNLKFLTPKMEIPILTWVMIKMASCQIISHSIFSNKFDANLQNLSFSSGTILWDVYVQLLQSCLTLCDPRSLTLCDCRPPYPSVHGLFQARILKWGVMPSPRGSSWLRAHTCISSVSYSGRRVLCHLGSSSSELVPLNLSNYLSVVSIYIVKIM